VIEFFQHDDKQSLLSEQSNKRDHRFILPRKISSPLRDKSREMICRVTRKVPPQ